MQGRSWMAALTVAVGIVLPLARQANADEKPATKGNTVYLQLRIAGLDRDGCDVEIKPSHSGCQFRTVRQHVDQTGLQTLRLDDVKTSSADRECAFSITIREAGQATRTVRRGLRLAAPETAPFSTMECFISSPSKLAKAEQEKRTR
ncbi:hypothetical protein V5E97_38525 [Singulisphaera sp. Ch08]|uniref:Uncharacterized protein n=1 Tax=Singulisphaera sp. Ch08 TaxID=3120278 RepID=A0AAU7CGL5_9BACT